MNRSQKRFVVGLAILLALSFGFYHWQSAQAANHREAPITALDHKADITDFFVFRSYETGQQDKVTFILNIDPLLEPSNGPNFFPFDPEIRYAIRIDNNADAVADLAFEFRFNTEIRLPGVFTSLVGAGSGLTAPSNAPLDLDGNPTEGALIVPPAITALDGPGSEGFGLRQTYSVTLLRGGDGSSTLSEGRTLYAVPSNAGPRTMPDYPALADQGVYDLGDGIRVFAGTVEDPFWIDLGAFFDTANLRVPVLTDVEDLQDSNIGEARDDVAGFNVNSIAIEVPIAMVLQEGTNLGSSGGPSPNSSRATIGAWGTTSRPRVTVRGGSSRGGSSGFVPRYQTSSNRPSPGAFVPVQGFVQIQRMGNPLINELIIGTGSKDKFSQSQPKDDAQFAYFAIDPVLARVLNAAFGIAVPNPPRLDLLPLVQYVPPIASPSTPPGPIADLLRVNLGVHPTPANQIRRLGLLAGDPAGFPNGRRLQDDVVDIATRVVAGVLAGGAFAQFPNNRLGDGVNSNDVSYRGTFPYLGYAHSGRNSRHVDPGEIDCAPNCP